MTSTADTLTQARAAVADVVPSLVALLSGVRDTSVASVGDWTVGDVAAHLSHVFQCDTDVLAGRPAPPATVTTAGMAELNAGMLAGDDDRDPSALAERISALAAEFDETASRPHEATVDWLQGARLPAAAVGCHLLEECLIHGWDIARAVGRPWSMARHHALLAIEEGVLPLVAALPPDALLDHRKAETFRARFELRLRGGGSTVMVFDRGSMTLDAAGTGDIDTYISADPATFMLVFIGRSGVVEPVLRGQLAAWGWRPWKLTQMLGVISPP